MSLSTECVSDVMVIAFGPVGSYVDMSAYYTKEEIDNKGYLTEHQDISGKADKATTYTKSEVDTALGGKQETLVSGNNVKTINNESLLGSGNINIQGGGGVQSDWNVSDTSSMAYIKNKPTIPTVPSNVSAFTNDAGYLTQHQSLTNYYTKTEVNSAIVDSNPVIEDTRSALASKITGVASFSTLVDKQRVTIHLAFVTGNSTTLELTLSDGVTTTGVIPVYARTSGSSLGQISDSMFRAGTYMELIYNSTQNRWYCLNLDRDTTTWRMGQTEIDNSSNSDPRSVPTAKLLRDNFYLKSEINTMIGDIETLLANI